MKQGDPPFDLTTRVLERKIEYWTEGPGSRRPPEFREFRERRLAALEAELIARRSLDLDVAVRRAAARRSWRR